MSGFLVPINKSAKTKVAGAAATAGTAKVTQKTIQGAVKEGIKRAKTVADEAAPKAHVPPGTPANKISERTMRFANPQILVPAGVLAATGASVGAYKYKKRRVEKSLSLMQHDFPSVMMSTT